MSEDPLAAVTIEPLRTNSEGNAIYPEWDDSWMQESSSFSSPAEPEPESTTSKSVAVDPPSDFVSSGHLQALRNWESFRKNAATRHFDKDVLLHGVEKIYSTSQVVEIFFGRSPNWMYWGLRKDRDTGRQVFSYRDGSPIEPERMGPMGKRRYTLPIIREIALSCHRRGTIKEEELLEIMGKILLAEFGEAAFSPKKKKSKSPTGG